MVVSIKYLGLKDYIIKAHMCCLVLSDCVHLALLCVEERVLIDVPADALARIKETVLDVTLYG